MARKPKVFISCPLFSEAENLFKEDFELYFPSTETGLTNMQQLARCTDISAAIISVADKITTDVLNTLPGTLKAIATYSVGTNHIDTMSAYARGVAVINTPDVLSESCADTTLLLMLGASRRAVEGIELIRSGKWAGWQPDQLLGKDVWGQRLGIYGMGRIGKAVARRAMGFGMIVHYHNRSQLPDNDEKGARYHPTLESMMRESDFFCIACPPHPENVGIIDRKRLALLPDNSVVVNISRGDLIQDEALIEALQSGRVAAAGLDVFANEPDINPAYRSMKNVFSLPHLGSSTLGTRLNMAALLRDGLKKLLIEGVMPANVVKNV